MASPEFPPCYAGPSQNGGIRFGYPERVPFVYNCSPVSGFAACDGNTNLNTLATPANVSAAAGASFVCVAPIRLPYRSGDAPSGVTLYQFTAIRARYYRAGASDTLTIKLLEFPLDDSAAPTQLESYDETTEFTTTGSWATYNDTGLSHALDVASNRYALQISGSANALNSSAFADVRVTIEKFAVE
jgi:hypothetical protein